MRYTLYIIFFFFAFSALGIAQPQIQLETFATGFDRPVDISNAGDSRLFITEQDGYIRIVNSNGTTNPTAFLNIDARVRSSGNEQGLLGLCFHPNYAENGYFYVNYTDNNGDTKISRFTVTANPDVADPNSELVLYEVEQPYSNHNAGDLDFGPDGYLYFGLGDGGAADDPGNRSQNPQNPLGKMIRIDVDNGSPYAIPADNPFVGNASTLDEIWAIGVRNPWRFCFDRLTGDMWIADVGQDAWEEIDFQPASSAGGENYGWRCREGFHGFNSSGCGPATDYVEPVVEYANNFATGCSVTGGYVYRGSEYAAMYGYYLYADYCTGIFWGIAPDGNGGWTNTQLANLTDYQYSTFGEDMDGEMYVAALDAGIIYHITETSCNNLVLNPTVENESCLDMADGSITLNIGTPASSYTVLWDMGSTAESMTNLAGGTSHTVTVTDANECTKIETFTIETFNPETPVIAASGSLMLCEGESVDLSVTDAPIALPYQWFLDGTAITDATNGSFTATVAGSYTIMIGGDCPSELSEAAVVSINTNPTIPTITQLGNTLTASEAAMTYQWSLNGNVIDGAIEQDLEITEDGDYTVMIMDANGCEVISDPYNAMLSAIVDMPSLNAWRLYPNPTSAYITLELDFDNGMDLEWRVIDILGRTVLSDTREINANGQYKRNINLENLTSGVYFLEIQTDEGKLAKKIVKR